MILWVFLTIRVQRCAAAATVQTSVTKLSLGIGHVVKVERVLVVAHDRFEDV